VGFWVYKQEMCAPSWEMLVKKSELNPQKLAFSSNFGHFLPSQNHLCIFGLGHSQDSILTTMKYFFSPRHFRA
jgi:hypothetical protein